MSHRWSADFQSATCGLEARAPRLALALLLGLAACGTVPVTPLAYTPTAPLPSPSSKPVLALRTVVDDRNVDPRAIGTAQSDLATGTQTLWTPTRLATQVDQAFVTAIVARGLQAPPGTQRYDLTVHIRRLDGRQRLTFAGHADLVVIVTRHDTGRIVYQDEVTAQTRGSTVPSLDTLAFVPTGDVTLATDRAMSAAIDMALDKPALRAALTV